MASAPANVCSVCGEPLTAKGACLACLLRGGLNESDQAVGHDLAAVFDDFEIARRDDGSLWELGRGGMGVTYRATEKTLHRDVALKVIDTHGSAAVRERFLREARAAAALRHPHVAGVFRFGAMAGGDRCVVRWLYRWGTDEAAHVRGVDVFRVREGHVVEKLAYVKG